jgi:hypothetical protein
LRPVTNDPSTEGNVQVGSEKCGGGDFTAVSIWLLLPPTTQFPIEALCSDGARVARNGWQFLYGPMLDIVSGTSAGQQRCGLAWDQGYIEAIERLGEAITLGLEEGFLPRPTREEALSSPLFRERK